MQRKEDSSVPQLFKFGGYCIYFWSNENKPLEPVHVHVAYGRPSRTGTKIWITSESRALLANNNSGIPKPQLNYIIRFIEANSQMILESWAEHFGQISYYC